MADTKDRIENLGVATKAFSEKNDCTVRAAAAALDIPYQAAREKLKALGRKPRHGFRFREDTIGRLGFESLPEYSCKTWATVQQELPKVGSFVVRVRRHVFAVVNGVVVETRIQPPRRQVRMVYCVKTI